MKISNHIVRLAGVYFLFLLLNSCGTNDIYIEGGNPTPPGGVNTPGTVNGEMEYFEVYGIVTDSQGNPLENVTVYSGSSSVVTSESGAYYFNYVDCVDGRFLLNFFKDGYFPIQKSDYTNHSSNVNHVNVMMKELNPYDRNVTRATISSGYFERVSTQNVDIDFYGNYKNASTGESYEGDVTVWMFELSPENENFGEYMPGGDLLALNSDGNPASLISYGMVNVILTGEDGQRLQIADGSSANITFNIPSSMVSGAPSVIPLWSFDETKGLWTRGEDAVMQSSGSYYGEVSHFSWVNLDYPEDVAYVDGYVRNEAGEPIEGIKVLIDGWKKVTTNYNGYYWCAIPADTPLKLSIPSAYYANYQPEFNTTFGPVPAQTTERIDITLPDRRKIYGNIHYSNGETSSFLFILTLNGEESSPLYTDKYGNFYYYISNDIQGEASINVLSAGPNKYIRSFVVLENEDTYVDVTINAHAGDPDIVATCGPDDRYYLTVPRVGATDLNGVIIADNLLIASTEGRSSTSGQYRTFMIIIQNFAESETSYENVSFFAQNGNVIVYCINASGWIYHEPSDNYVFNFSGDGYVIVESDTGEFSKPAKIDLSNVGIAHLATMESRKFYMPSSPFPSFTPRLDTPAPLATLITKSKKLGTGGMLYYNGGMNEYKELCMQASKSGLSEIESPDFNSSYDEAVYFSDINNKTLLLDLDGGADPIDPDRWMDIEPDSGFDAIAGFEFDAPISILAIEGGILSFMDIEDELDSPMRLAARPLKKAAYLMKK